MKKTITTFLLLASLCISHAVIWKFDLSPPGTDHAVGLSPLNEVPAVTNSTGSGNEIGPGITFDTSTLTLTLSVGYGSAFGFSNLSGPATVMHIHGQAPTNIAAPVLINLASNHTYAANPTNGGFIGGSVVYTPEQAAFLLAGSNYINIHTALNPGGEIRGQLIATNNAPTIACPAASTNECDGSGGRLVALNAQVADLDGDALTVVWTVDGAPVQTNSVPPGGPPTSATVTLIAFLTLGQHAVVVSVSDGKAATVTCSSTATIVDTTPPVITSATATPNVLWPPNNKMVRIALNVVATDICSSVTCRIKSVSSDEPPKAHGKGANSSDWTITGPQALLLRATRAGKGDGRTYSITVECRDTSGNTATKVVTVTVPHDQRDHASANGTSSPPGTPPTVTGPSNKGHKGH